MRVEGEGRVSVEVGGVEEVRVWGGEGVEGYYRVEVGRGVGHFIFHV